MQTTSCLCSKQLTPVAGELSKRDYKSQVVQSLLNDQVTDACSLSRSAPSVRKLHFNTPMHCGLLICRMT